MAKPKTGIEQRVIWHDRPVSVSLVASFFGVSRTTVYTWIRKGKLGDTSLSTLLQFAAKHPDKVRRHG